MKYDILESFSSLLKSILDRRPRDPSAIPIRYLAPLVFIYSLHFISCIFVIYYKENENREWYKSIYYLTLDRTQVGLSNLCLFIELLIIWFNYPKIIFCVTALKEVRIKSNELCLKCRYSFRGVVLLAIAAYSVVSTVAFIDIVFHSETFYGDYIFLKVIDNVVSYSPVYVAFFTHLLFYSYLENVHKQLEYFRRQIFRIGSNTYIDDKVYLIRTLLILKNQLTSLCQVAIKIYEWQIIFRVINILSNSSFNTYTFISIASAANDLAETSGNMVALAGRFIIYSIELYILVSQCYACSLSVRISCQKQFSI